jgi:aspartate aminotransferase-like enzyme
MVKYEASMMNFSPSSADARECWREHLDKPYLYPRTDEFSDLIRSISADLKELCGSRGRVLLLTAAGTTALECALASLSDECRLLVLRNGHFGNRLYEIARKHFRSVYHFDLSFGEPFREEHAEAFSAEIKKRKAEAVVLTHLETSSTVVNDVSLAAKIARSAGALTIVDGVSSVGAVDCKLEAWGVNCFVAASYKALLTPAGLNFILTDESYLNLARRDWSYAFDLHRLVKAADENRFQWSPNVLNLYCLQASLRTIQQEGKEHYFRRLEQNAQGFRKQLSQAGLRILGDPRFLSPCFTAVQLDADHADLWLQLLKRDYGIIIGKGIGEQADRILRIGHYPHRTMQDLDFLAKALSGTAQKVMNSV